jgi:hypothetical protein
MRPKLRGCKPTTLPQLIREVRHAHKSDKLLTAEQRIAKLVKIAGEENRDRVQYWLLSLMEMQAERRSEHERHGKLRNKRFANQFEAARRRMATLVSKAPAEWWESSTINRDQLLRHFDDLRVACASKPPIDEITYRTYLMSDGENSTPSVYHEKINKSADDRGRARGPYFEARNKALAAMAAFALCTECGMNLKAKIAALLYGDERACMEHHCRSFIRRGMCVRHVLPKPPIRGRYVPGSAV